MRQGVIPKIPRLDDLLRSAGRKSDKINNKSNRRGNSSSKRDAVPQILEIDEFNKDLYRKEFCALSDE